MIAMSKAVDVHNHFYPPAYLAEIARADGVARLEHLPEYDDPVLSYEGDYNILVPGHRDIDARSEDMRQAGIDLQVLSLTTPGVHVEEEAFGVHLAQATNDSFAEICRRHPGRFEAFAALPLQAPEAAADELQRCVTDLGFVGGTLFSNVNGLYLDAPEFEPVYTVAQELGVPLFVHPTTPAAPDAFLDYRLVAILGFLVDTSVTIARMIFSGVFDRHPKLTLIAGHLGATLPYVQERFDRGWEVYPEISRALIRRPSDYLRSNVYYDAVSFDPDALCLARAFAGAEHILLGSDYPHQVGDMHRAIKTVSNLDWPAGEKQLVLRGNAAALLGLK